MCARRSDPGAGMPGNRLSPRRLSGLCEQGGNEKTNKQRHGGCWNDCAPQRKVIAPSWLIFKIKHRRTFDRSCHRDEAGSNLGSVTSALGQKQTSAHLCVMSALPPKADIAERDCHVRFVPK